MLQRYFSRCALSLQQPPALRIALAQKPGKPRWAPSWHGGGSSCLEGGEAKSQAASPPALPRTPQRNGSRRRVGVVTLLAHTGQPAQRLSAPKRRWYGSSFLATDTSGLTGVGTSVRSAEPLIARPEVTACQMRKKGSQAKLRQKSSRHQRS